MEYFDNLSLNDQSDELPVFDFELPALDNNSWALGMPYDVKAVIDEHMHPTLKDLELGSKGVDEIETEIQNKYEKWHYDTLGMHNQLITDEIYARHEYESARDEVRRGIYQNHQNRKKGFYVSLDSLREQQAKAKEKLDDVTKLLIDEDEKRNHFVNSMHRAISANSKIDNRRNNFLAQRTAYYV